MERNKDRRPKKRVKKVRTRISPAKRENNRITFLLGLICSLFVFTILYLSYFQIVKSDEVAKHSSNKRIYAEQEKTLRGSIFDRNGELLVHSEFDENGVQKRVYDKTYNYSHIVGYNYKSYGNSGLEESYNTELLNIKTQNSPLVDLQNIISDDEEKYGNDLIITIDDSLQNKAYKELGDNRGSIIVMDTETGEIYAMASNPSFNVSNLNEEWSSIVEREDSPLINRATTGLYPPGSIFKIVTATGILEDLDPEEQYTSTGSITTDGYTLRDFDEIAYGPVGLKDAFRQSVNTYFASRALDLGSERLQELARKYKLGENIPFDIPIEKSRFQFGNMSKADLMATSIGQGKTLATPINMVMMASAIANDGEMIKPILVKEIRDHKGRSIKTNETEIISTVTSPEIAEEIKDMMVTVVNSPGGTGRDAALENITMAGKTGTAEVEDKASHAWFTGFAPAEEPKIAVVVMLENVGHTGGKVAAPIAKHMVEEALDSLIYE
ncbi:MAG: penicillin-binding transpeptidase domain-containing protein [Andreesenia angusta]|nr:penicillin-binding transpeptidase domain-containing protein [Andreesenia angusta]